MLRVLGVSGLGEGVEGEKGAGEVGYELSSCCFRKEE